MRFIATDDEVLTGVIAARGSGRTVLVDARRVVAPYPDATVRYVLDGRSASLHRSPPIRCSVIRYRRCNGPWVRPAPLGWWDVSTLTVQISS